MAAEIITEVPNLCL